MDAKEYKITAKKQKNGFKPVEITSVTAAVQFARKFYHEDIGLYESFFLILLNNAKMTIGYAKIAQGGITGTTVDVAIVAKYAIDSLATDVILVHNHPSGNIKPSKADKILTYRIKQTLGLFFCSVVDHLIIARNGFYSMSNEGLI